MKPDYTSDDFGTANPSFETGRATAMAYAAADALRLSDLDARKFTQGFIHAAQGRTDLLGTGSAMYDAGHACGVTAAP